MKSIRKHHVRAAILLSLFSLHGSGAYADSLVTNEGEFIIGAVHKTATGYSVDTKDGVVQVKAADVRSILLDHPAATGPHTGSTKNPQLNIARAPKPSDAKTLSLLLEQGQNAFGAADFITARNAFSDALMIDPKNSIAGRGLGLTYLKLKKPDKAAVPLQLAMSGLPMTRGLMLGLASAMVASHDAIGAAKLIQNYLQAHPQFESIDEPVLNALGIALWQSDPAAMHTSVFTDGVKLYSTLNSQLEATQPGKRRWGTEWLPASDVTDRQKARRAAQIKVDQAWENLQDINTQLQTAQTALTAATKLPAKNPQRDQQMKDAAAAIDPLKARQETAQKEYDAMDAELAALPGPVFPSIIELADADFPPMPVGSNSRVMKYAAAFAVAPDVMVTAADAVEGAADIQVTTFDGKTFKATVLRMHHGDGLALLEINGAKVPCLRLASESKPGALICMGYPDVDLVTPVAKPMEVTAGPITTEWTVQFAATPRIPGAPLLKNGNVVGMELGDRDTELSAVPASTLKELQSLVENEEPPTLIATDAKKAVVQVAAQH